MYDYFNVDVLEPSMEELRLWLPESNVPKKTGIVFTTREMETWLHGIAEGIHTANRGENITIIFATMASME